MPLTHRDRPRMSLNQFRIRHKLILLVAITLFSIIITAALAALQSRADLLDARKAEVRSVVQAFSSVLSSLSQDAEQHHLSSDTLRQQARALLDSARYRHNEYLFLLTDDGIMVSNPVRPDLEGKNIRDFRDDRGNNLSQALFAQIDDNNAVYWHYRWPRRDQWGGTSQDLDKLSYVQRVSGTNWLLGSGVYLQDVDAQFLHHLLILAALTLIYLIIALYTALRVARNISDPLSRLTLATHRLSEGELDLDIDDTDRDDEIGTMARATRLLQTQAQENRRLRKLSEHARFLEEFDPVTRLYNRQALGEALAREITRQHQHDSRLAVLVIRLVLLREIAAQWGRECSNQVLIQVVDRLRPHLRVDDVLARHGEDTLTLLRPDAGDDTELRTLLHELLETVAAPITVNGQPFALHARIGISLYPEDGDQEFQLIGRAEEALRAARRAERDWVWFNSLGNAPVDQRLSLWQEIQVALEEDQFYLVFQPIFALDSNQPVSAEVLLRWRHPQKGQISPALFIPFAEQTGLVNRIDRWVINAVARQLRDWQAQGIPLPSLAINLSGISFLRPDLEQLLRDSFEPASHLLSHLELELTEGVLIEDLERIDAQLKRLRRLGTHVAIDDFGTGYSSLSRVRNLDIDHIKIDQSFIDDIEDSAQGRTVVEAIIHMAKGLRLQVVAEGVETEGQLHQLRQMGCDLVQGYLLSHPLELEAFERLIGQELEIDLD